MVSDTDFLALYHELELNPGACGLSELKRAYRRRVVQLHPDRCADEQSNPPDPERLQRLTALYGAAIAFERRYGRLPGAEPASRRAVSSNGSHDMDGGNVVAGNPPSAARREPTSPHRGTPEPTAMWRRYLLALLILLALAWAVWGVGVTN
ncbi:MAG: J domain-containing protein [Rhodanobacteraceae bacterium]